MDNYLKDIKLTTYAEKEQINLHCERTAGIAQGLVQGRNEGLVQGRNEGLVQGRNEGLIQGRNEGATNKMYEIARKLLETTDNSIETISNCTGLKLCEVNKLKKQVEKTKTLKIS